jgi:RNA polymerase-binding transcription factor DksA
MAHEQSRNKDPLLAKAEEIERLRRFVDRTSFAGDEREVADELAAVDQHPADIADVTLQREDDYAAKVVLDHEAEEIQRALKRKQQGCYGICANCGRPIPRERLEARPEAIYCIDCQRLLEGHR